MHLTYLIQILIQAELQCYKKVGHYKSQVFSSVYRNRNFNITT
jgi:hypothetical protein